ncbi:MAG TPA: hypothetical protein VIT67_12270 [Povalibacter sp.]|jgi:hypothetical protein
MVSKTSLLPLVRAFDWRAVDAGLKEKPQLIQHRDDRGRNWLHLCCASPLDGRDARSSIRTADVLLATASIFRSTLSLKAAGERLRSGSASRSAAISLWPST